MSIKVCVIISVIISCLVSCSGFLKQKSIEMIITPLQSPENYTASIYYEYGDSCGNHDPQDDLDIEMLIGLTQSGEIIVSGKHYRHSKIRKKEFDRLLAYIISSDLWENRKKLKRLTLDWDPKKQRKTWTSFAWDPEKEVYDTNRIIERSMKLDGSVLDFLSAGGHGKSLIIRLGKETLKLYRHNSFVDEIPREWSDRLSKISGNWKIRPWTKPGWKRRRVRGESVRPDTPRNRKRYLDIYEKEIMEEYTMGREYFLPGAGGTNWDESWERTFELLRDGGHENPKFYINYIKKRRKELGLPKD